MIEFVCATMEASAARHSLIVCSALLVLFPALLVVVLNVVSREGKSLVAWVAACFALTLFVFDAALVTRQCIGAWDQLVLERVSALTPFSIRQALSALTHLGDPLSLTLLCVIVCAVMFYLRRFSFAIFFAAAAASNGLLSQALKAATRRARPESGAIVPMPDSFSFPSGHTSGSMVCYGMLAYVVVRLCPERWHAIVIAVAALLISSIGVSRVAIGVHFPSDVLGGFASGAACLFVFVAIAESYHSDRRGTHR